MGGGVVGEVRGGKRGSVDILPHDVGSKDGKTSSSMLIGYRCQYGRQQGSAARAGVKA